MTPRPTEFHHAAVRDLAWCVYGAPLLNDAAPHLCHTPADWLASLYDHPAQWLAQLDREPQALQAWLSRRTTRRLGHYFEQLLGFWFQHADHVELVASNQALQGDAGTLGEFDFLLREAACEALTHLEVAVKFYLGIGELSQQVAWVGPGLKDRLDRKRARLLRHQTQLGLRHRERHGMAIERARLLVKGRLFYPPAGTTASADWLATGHECGFWQTRKDFAERDGDWQELPRSCWLGRNLPDAEQRARQQSSPADAAFMVNVADPARQPLFVVPDDWPQQALRYSASAV